MGEFQKNERAVQQVLRKFSETLLKRACLNSTVYYI